MNAISLFSLEDHFAATRWKPSAQRVAGQPRHCTTPRLSSFPFCQSGSSITVSGKSGRLRWKASMVTGKSSQMASLKAILPGESVAIAWIMADRTTAASSRAGKHVGLEKVVGVFQVYQQVEMRESPASDIRSFRRTSQRSFHHSHRRNETVLSVRLAIHPYGKI
jgi:hypothetical protein